MDICQCVLTSNGASCIVLCRELSYWACFCPKHASSIILITRSVPPIFVYLTNAKTKRTWSSLISLSPSPSSTSSIPPEALKNTTKPKMMPCLFLCLLSEFAKLIVRYRNLQANKRIVDENNGVQIKKQFKKNYKHNSR